MSVIVEDGTLVPNANSYASEADLVTYCTSRGYTLVGNASTLLVLAADYIESQLFIGDKSTKTQTMLWPRIPGTLLQMNYGYGGGFGNIVPYPSYALWVDGYIVQKNEIPTRLKNAQLEVAYQLDQGNDYMTPKGQAILSTKVGPMEVEFQKGTSETLYLRKVSNLLAPLLKQSGANVSVGRA